MPDASALPPERVIVPRYSHSSILGLYTNYLSRINTKSTTPNRTMKLHPATEEKAAFTLIELLVVIAIIAILASVLLPVLEMAKEKALVAECLANQKQLVMAWKLYADENNDHIVGANCNTRSDWRISPAGTDFIMPIIPSSIPTSPTQNRTLNQYLDEQGFIE